MIDDKEQAAKLLEMAMYRITNIGWCTGAYARDAAGHPCGVSSPLAVRWCAEGALILEGKNFAPSVLNEADRALRDAAKQVFGVSTLSVNDGMGQPQVIKAYLSAIESLESP